MQFFRTTFARAASCLGAGAFALLGLAGCAQGAGSSLGYYWQSLSGHVQLMQAARPVDDWITTPGTAPALSARLELARRARAFAVHELHLPDNPSYHRYADLGRASAVWNVVAAPPFSLQLHTWCFPVVGCVGYRGYFAQQDAQAEASRLAAEGLEVDVYGVPAYSTLGAMNWAGGDPLLNTFIRWPEGDFVRLLFHELAHQKVYAKDDTLFNESFASAVGALGSQAWLRTQADDAARAAFATAEQEREKFRALVRQTRDELAEIYKQKDAPALDEQALAAMKNEAMARFRQRYQALSADWGFSTPQRAGYDAWVRRANNASFAAQAAYDEWVPAFQALFGQCGSDWPRFYAAVQSLADDDPAARKARLAALLRGPTLSAKERFCG